MRNRRIPETNGNRSDRVLDAVEIVGTKGKVIVAICQ